MPENRYSFNGIEHIAELELDMAAFRSYDAAIGRWMQVDPLAEKYYAMSPYNGMGNNPILYSDPMGDSLWIDHKGDNYLYDGGKLYLNGKEYTGRVKGFLKQTTDALGLISSSLEGSAMISELTSSTNNFTIKRGKTEFKSSDVKKAYANQILSDPTRKTELNMLTKAGVSLSGGSGGTIYWDPSGSVLPTVTGLRTAAFSDLAHEMFHGLDANRGLLDDRAHMDPEVDRSEWQAVYRENMMRDQLKMPLRTHYLKTSDPSGNILGGAGPRMINSLNKPILPIWYKP